MKDIDFDELDKAVNSLMASTSAASSPSPAPAVPEASAAAPSAPEPAVVAPVSPVVDTSTPVNVTVSTPQPVARATPPAMRRTGRFMDMMPSSADTKPRPSAAPSREGISLSPRTDPTPSPAPVISEPVAEEPVTPSVSDGNMPDPLDLLLAQDEAPVTDVEPPTATEEQSTLMSTVPLESPFLTDAKVDKRPLNSESVFEPEMVSTPTTLVEPDKLDEPVVENEPEVESKADEPPLSPRAPELDTQLVAIESGSKEITAPDESAPAVPLGATSIAQQYTAQPSSGDQSHAAIYDSSQYPEPLKHPAKSKSGWLWVLWVALLLGVGAGGAILLYNFGIIP